MTSLFTMACFMREMGYGQHAAIRAVLLPKKTELWLVGGVHEGYLAWLSLVRIGVLMPCWNQVLQYRDMNTVHKFHTVYNCTRQTKILIYIEYIPWLEGWPPLAWAFRFVSISSTPIIIRSLCFPCCCLSCEAVQKLCGQALAQLYCYTVEL